MRRLAILAGQLLIVLLLLDGFVDVAYPTARFVITRGRALMAPDGPERANEWSEFGQRILAGVGNMPAPVTSPLLNVDGTGRRSTGQTPGPGPSGLLLGSSQAFGFGVADGDTFAAALERRLGGVSVMTYAGPGRATSESMTQWLRLDEDGIEPDFVLMLFSNVEIAEDCWAVAPTYRSERRPALIRVPKQVSDLLSSDGGRDYPCRSEEARNWVVARGIYEIRSAIAAARDLDTPFALIVAPTLYGNDAPNDALRAQMDPETVRTMDLTVRELRRRLAAERIPGVYDLSEAFDEQPEVRMLDIGSHFDRKGAEILAQAVVERLPAGFFSEAGPRSSLPPTGAGR